MARTKTIDDTLAGINTLRDRIADLTSQRDEITAQPQAASDIERRILTAVKNDMPQDFYLGFDASYLIDNPSGFGGLERGIKTSPIGALAVIFGADVIAKGLARHAVAYAATQGEGISDDERTTRLAVISSNLADAERDEERLCRIAERAGFLVERRADANPLLLIMEAADLGGVR